jgi:hypothetical protein
MVGGIGIAPIDDADERADDLAEDASPPFALGDGLRDVVFDDQNAPR